MDVKLAKVCSVACGLVWRFSCSQSRLDLEFGVYSDVYCRLLAPQPRKNAASQFGAVRLEDARFGNVVCRGVLIFSCRNVRTGGEVLKALQGPPQQFWPRRHVVRG